MLDEHRIANWQAEKVKIQKAVDWIDRGNQHIEENAQGLLIQDVTEEYRSEKLRQIARIDSLIALESREGSFTQSG